MTSITLPVYDLKEGCFLPDSCNVIYRNTLLGYLYPNIQFAIGDVGTHIHEGVSPKEIASILDAGFEDYFLVGASGSRKHGRVVYAKGDKEVFTRYFGNSNMHAINYGSNLTTECKSIVNIPVSLLVVKDGEWRTGDCHGKAKANLLYSLVNSIRNPVQFRAASSQNLWIAKGTISHGYEVDDSSYDLVLPVSCFKGNKVKAGEYKLDLVIGVVFTSPEKKNEERRNDWRSVNLSYSVLQFLPWIAVEKDILPRTLKACSKLNDISSNSKKLTEYLFEEEDEEDVDLEGESKLEKIIRNDSYSQLTTHPWVIQKVSQLLQKRWLTLATAGDVNFNSSMVMPDEDLPDDCCYIPGLKDGDEVIVFPYPCRWKHDIKVWTNKVLPHWQYFEGVLIVNQKTAMKLGRDFDGDFLMWLPATKLPTITTHLKTVIEPDNQEKLKVEKRTLTGSLGEIAVLSMSNDTGLITWLIAKAWANGKEDYVNRLVPQLQAAVDSLKGAEPPDKKLMNEIGYALKEKDVAWLTQMKKDKDVYLKHPLEEDSRTDTISMMVKSVNAIWIPPTLRSSNVRAFAPLFPQAEDKWRLRARQRIGEYSQDIKRANAPAESYIKEGKPIPLNVQEACDKRRKEVVEYYSELLRNCDSEQAFKAVSAFWDCKHNSNSTDSVSASICFIVGIDQICERLQTLHLNRVDLALGNRNGEVFTDYPERVWKGENVWLKLVPVDKYIYAYDNKERRLGSVFINQTPPIMLGDWIGASLYTRFSSKNLPTKIEAFVDDF